MKQGSTPSLPVRRISSNSFEVLENSSQNSSSTRKRRKKHSKPSLQDEFVQEVLRPATPTHFLSATNSPNARLLHSPFTPERRPLERSLTDLTTLSQVSQVCVMLAESPYWILLLECRKQCCAARYHSQASNVSFKQIGFRSCAQYAGAQCLTTLQSVTCEKPFRRQPPAERSAYSSKKHRRLQPSSTAAAAAATCFSSAP